MEMCKYCAAPTELAGMCVECQMAFEYVQTLGSEDWAVGPTSNSKVGKSWTRTCFHVMTPVHITALNKPVYASAYSDLREAKNTELDTPTVGVYLDSLWLEHNALTVSPDFPVTVTLESTAPYPVLLVELQDYAAPPIETLREVIRVIVTLVRADHKVEIGCVGGHGRTGTILAGLTMLDGSPADQAIAHVKKIYCERAVESEAQILVLQQWGEMIATVK